MNDLDGFELRGVVEREVLAGLRRGVFEADVAALSSRGLLLGVETVLVLCV